MLGRVIGVGAGDREVPFELSDGQDLERCPDQLQRLTDEASNWLRRRDDYRVVVDLTGGTKAMSAAIALQASRWQCLFCYVGGRERTKEGVGVVVPSAEIIVQQASPWDVVGYQALEEFLVLFDGQAFGSAGQVAEAAKRRVSRANRKCELSVLEQLARAFDAWDRFDHRTSRNLFKDVDGSASDLRSARGWTRRELVLERVRRLLGYLKTLWEMSPRSQHHVIDMLANAKCRREEGRFDDAVARLYRAIEAIAQLALKERDGLESTETVRLDPVPPSLRVAWEPRVRGGVLALGLQDGYALVLGLNDPLGQRSKERHLDATPSPLAARNPSILEHVYDRVSDVVFDKFWTGALSVAETTDSQLPVFPRLLAVSARGRP